MWGHGDVVATEGVGSTEGLGSTGSGGVVDVRAVHHTLHYGAEQPNVSGIIHSLSHKLRNE